MILTSDGKMYKTECHQDTRKIPFSMKTNKQLVVVNQELNHRGGGNKSPIIGSHVLNTTGADAHSLIVAKTNKIFRDKARVELLLAEL